MTDLRRLGDELRSELGDPPASFADRQRLRLRGLDLEPAPQRRPILHAAVLAACTVLALSVYYWPEAKTGAIARTDVGAPPQREQIARNDEVWVEASVKPTKHRLKDGSEIALEPGARGRLEQRVGLGTRFDLHEGTAAFDVKKQQGRPFSVVAGQYRVVVVGTQFSTAYVPPSELSVAVNEGVVQVHMPGRAAPLSVEAGEMLEIQGREFSLHEQREDASVPDPDGPTGVDENQTAKAKGFSGVSWQELYRQGKYQQACEDARSHSLSELRARLSASDLIELASALRLCGDAAGAMSTLDALRQRFPGSSHSHDALFLIGRIHATRGQSAAAISRFDQYLAGAGQGRFAAEALGRLIELHEGAGNRQKARIYAQKYLQMAPQGPYRRLAESVTGNPQR